MKRLFTAVLLVSALALTVVYSISETEVSGTSSSPENAPALDPRPDTEHRLKGVQLVTAGFGTAFTDSRIFVSEDRGASWSEIPNPADGGATLSALRFLDTERAWLIAASKTDKGLTLSVTRDRGTNWTTLPIRISDSDRSEASLDSVELESDGVRGRMVIRLASSSNFIRTSVYATSDAGKSWRRVSTDSVIASDRTASAPRLESSREAAGIPKTESIIAQTRNAGGAWVLTQEGTCQEFKSGCYQTSRIHDITTGAAVDITPPAIREMTEEARVSALSEGIQKSAMPPGGSTRISLNRGFDKCTAATSAQMKTWWDNSPYYDANIYMSGRNRGCTQAQLTASWVDTVSRQGWGLIPTIVGYQSPCSSCTSCQKHSSDPVVAEQQGREEADIAITDANNLGLLQGTVLYYDMEIYTDSSGTGACSTPTKAFLKGWTDRVKERGYISGVYGSPTNAMRDWVNIPSASQPQAVWWARWDNIMSVWTYTGLPADVVVTENVWKDNQRIKQWKGPHNDTWGGVTFNIDGNISDAPVAGVQLRNKNSDFDGDGKADFAVFRPDTSVWYVLTAGTYTFRAATFGLPTDVMTPGDFDGDGLTDLAVWRPQTGVWHRYSRAIYSAFQWGTTGDIPVAADYDGDGRTDVAVFRPSNGVWYIKNSLDSKGTSFRFEQFGVAGDRPVPADFDGDGKADLAVYRPSTGVWYVMRSSAGFYALQFGIESDKTAHGDYDGDGKADPAVYRDGTWYVMGSTSGFSRQQFGLPGDRPVPADFDGDGKTDLAVYRPSSGIWYVLGSTQGFLGVQFGVSSDTPVATAYTPIN